jgi:hypothetical protein
MEQFMKSSGPSDRPFRKVIVGVDEQQGGRDAAALARELVVADGSVLLVFVRVRDLLLAVPRTPICRRSGAPARSYRKFLLLADPVSWCASSRLLWGGVFTSSQTPSRLICW